MKQIYKYATRPVTINSGGYKKGKWIIWLNLDISEISNPENEMERYECWTERLTLSSNDFAGFLSVVNPSHIATATNDEVMAILKYFDCENNLSDWMAIRKAQIQGYDCSSSVNQFFFNDIPLWLDKATRVGLVNSITIEKNAGRTMTNLWFSNHSITIGVEQALGALSQLELYALDCYNITARHLLFVEQAESIEALKDFDITADYPEMLHFSIE